MILPLTMFDINSFRRLQNVMLRQIVSLNTGHCPCCGGEMRGRDNQMACDNCNQMMLTKTICPNPDCRHEYYYLSFDVSAETLSKMKDVDPDNFYQVDSYTSIRTLLICQSIPEKSELFARIVVNDAIRRNQQIFCGLL